MEEIDVPANVALQTRAQQATWYQALALRERLTAFTEEHKEQLNEHSTRYERVLKQLQRWMDQPAFQKEGSFARRLASEGINEKTFIALQTEVAEQLAQRLAGQVSLPWRDRLIDAFIYAMTTGQDAHSVADEIVAMFLQEAGPGGSAFLRPLRPLICDATERLLQGLQQLTYPEPKQDSPFDARSIMPILLQHLPERVVPKMIKTLVLELNVARIQGHLEGNTPEERFAYFVRYLDQNQGIQLIFAEYVVLARLVVEALDSWVTYELELLTRLSQDWPEIRTLLTPAKDPGQLVEIRAGQGDTHRGGRSVAVLTWSSGFQLVYKPRSLAVDTHFQMLLRWLNLQNEDFAFGTYRVLNKGQYGWVEFVHSQPCATPAEVERFYRRQGGYLALLYALKATDFHAENLIAVGEQPMLIDLEALLHPQGKQQQEERFRYPGVEALTHSVLHVGLLPHLFASDEYSEGVDISGLGGQTGQLTPTPVARWSNVGTDQMQLRQERVQMELGHHRATLQGHDVDTLAYRDVIIQGFQTVYRLLCKHRVSFLWEVLSLFGQDEIRCLLRPTRVYAILLVNSYHPDVLRDALERDRFFDHLWLEAAHKPYLAQCIPAEAADLRAGDIPLFTTHAYSRDLVTSQGEVIKDFFAASGLEMVRQQLNTLSEQDLARQSWIIEASFTSMTVGQVRTASITTDNTRQHKPRPLDLPDDLLSIACTIGDRLETLAITHSVDQTELTGWLGITMQKAREWHIMAAGGDLYNGVTGVSLFLAYLGALTKQERYTRLARRALDTAQYRFNELACNNNLGTSGAFSGLSSLIYLLTHLGKLWQDETLIREASHIWINHLQPLIEQDELFDIVSGNAGCLMVLLSLYATQPTEHVLALARRCGDHLLTHAQPQEHGIGWVAAHETRPLTGFAHGNAGIALALLRLCAVSGEERYRQAALDAIAYERAHFSPRYKNWADLRQFSTSSSQQEPSHMVAWCHGASGIALARLQSLAIFDDTIMRDEIDVALHTTLKEGFGMNHSLCHGDLGNLDILLQAAHITGRPEYHAHVERLKAQVLQDARRYGWLAATPQGVETPGLMLGLAGIGYGLLRLAAPTHVPSVLSLDAPI